MTLQQILHQLVSDFEGFAKLAAWVGVLLVLYVGRRVLLTLERIPSEQWFREVGDALKVLASHRQTVESHTDKLALLEAQVDDHETRLSHLQGQHELLHGVSTRVDAKGC